MNLCGTSLTQRLRCPDTQHYRFQSEQAKRLARQVTDTTIREKLLEMADEYGRYVDLIEARSVAPMAVTVAR